MFFSSGSLYFALAFHDSISILKFAHFSLLRIKGIEKLLDDDRTDEISQIIRIIHKLC